MRGTCLCGTVAFELQVEKLKIYQCHCSLCRRQSGTASSFGAVLSEEKFTWISGLASIRTWEKDTGFTSHFCSSCGSSVPNKFKGRPFYWVPAGLVESDAIETAANVFVSDKPRWSNVASHVNPYATRPDVEELLELLCDRAS